MGSRLGVSSWLAAGWEDASQRWQVWIWLLNATGSTLRTWGWSREWPALTGWTLRGQDPCLSDRWCPTVSRVGFCRSLTTPCLGPIKVWRKLSARWNVTSTGLAWVPLSNPTSTTVPLVGSTRALSAATGPSLLSSGLLPPWIMWLSAWWVPFQFQHRGTGTSWSWQTILPAGWRPSPSPIRRLRMWAQNWCLTLSAVSVCHCNFTRSRVETLKVPSSRKSTDFLRFRKLEQHLKTRVRMT